MKYASFLVWCSLNIIFVILINCNYLFNWKREANIVGKKPIWIQEWSEFDFHSEGGGNFHNYYNKGRDLNPFFKKKKKRRENHLFNWKLQIIVPFTRLWLEKGLAPMGKKFLGTPLIIWIKFSNQLEVFFILLSWMNK